MKLNFMIIYATAGEGNEGGAKKRRWTEWAVGRCQIEMGV